MATATYEWIRLYTDLEWVTVIHFDQEPFMWVSQLQRDRDVMAQLEVRIFLPKALPTPDRPYRLCMHSRGFRQKSLQPCSQRRS